MSKCFCCLFKTNYKEHGWSADVCLREKDFDKAMEACKDNNCSLDCEYHITSEQLSDLLDVIKKYQFVNVALVKLELKDFFKTLIDTECDFDITDLNSDIMDIIDHIPTVKLKSDQESH